MARERDLFFLLTCLFGLKFRSPFFFFLAIRLDLSQSVQALSFLFVHNKITISYSNMKQRMPEISPIFHKNDETSQLQIFVRFSNSYVLS